MAGREGCGDKRRVLRRLDLEAGLLLLLLLLLLPRPPCLCCGVCGEFACVREKKEA